MVQNPPLEQEYDHVVVGPGGGSTAAALAARKLGKNVVILEKEDKAGGSTSFSGGVWWVPHNHLRAAQGIPDSLDKAREYFESVVTYQGSGVTAPRRDAFLKAAPRRDPLGRGEQFGAHRDLEEAVGHVLGQAGMCGVPTLG